MDYFFGIITKKLRIFVFALIFFDKDDVMRLSVPIL